MSREIKFRAWDTLEKKWYQPIFEAYKGNLHELMISFSGELSVRDMNGMTHESLFPGRYILNQFTGLKDKNGKEIYEGDIIAKRNGKFYQTQDKKHYPVFECFEKVQWKEEKGNLNLIGWWPFNGDNDRYKEFEIIGNIYENPELLEPK